jgi:hypothetical protein
MKKSCFLIFYLALAFEAAAQLPYRHEAQITCFRIQDVEKDHFLQVGYYYNFNHRNAIGVRVSYHAEKKSEFYQSQTRYFEVSHRWRFQKPEQKFAWTLSSGPWVSIFKSQKSSTFQDQDDSWNNTGIVNTVGLHYHIIPRLSIGAVGLAMLEVFSWKRGGPPSFYPLISPGIGIQIAYAW